MIEPREQDELLSAYLDGELSDADRLAVEERLHRDPAARQTLDALRQAVAATKLLPRGRAPAELADAVRARLERRALLDDRHAAPGPRASGSWSRRFFAVAAGVLLSAGAGLMFVLSQDQRHAASLAMRELPVQQRTNEYASGGERKKTDERFKQQAAKPAAPEHPIADAETRRQLEKLGYLNKEEEEDAPVAGTAGQTAARKQIPIEVAMGGQSEIVQHFGGGKSDSVGGGVREDGKVFSPAAESAVSREPGRTPAAGDRSEPATVATPAQPAVTAPQLTAAAAKTDTDKPWWERSAKAGLKPELILTADAKSERLLREALSARLAPFAQRGGAASTPVTPSDTIHISVRRSQMNAVTQAITSVTDFISVDAEIVDASGEWRSMAARLKAQNDLEESGIRIMPSQPISSAEAARRIEEIEKNKKEAARESTQHHRGRADGAATAAVPGRDDSKNAAKESPRDTSDAGGVTPRIGPLTESDGQDRQSADSGRPVEESFARASGLNRQSFDKTASRPAQEGRQGQADRLSQDDPLVSLTIRIQTVAPASAPASAGLPR